MPIVGSLAWIVVVLLVTLAGAAEAGVSAAILILLALVGIVLVSLTAAYGLLEGWIRGPDRW
jgi:hypothetical protein